MTSTVPTDTKRSGKAKTQPPAAPRRMRTWVWANDSAVGRRYLLPPPRVEGVDWVPSGLVRFAGRERADRQKAATSTKTGSTPVVSSAIPAPRAEMYGPVGVPGNEGLEGASMSDVILAEDRRAPIRPPQQVVRTRRRTPDDSAKDEADGTATADVQATGASQAKDDGKPAPSNKSVIKKKTSSNATDGKATDLTTADGAPNDAATGTDDETDIPTTGLAPIGVPVEEDPEMLAAAEKDLVRAAANPALGTVLSRITGLMRWGAMAYALGRTGLADAYGIANNTPNIIYELVVGGVLSSTLVPLFVNTRRRTKRGETDDGASAILTVSSLALIVLSVIGVFAAPWIAKAYTLGLDPGARADQLELTIPLMRLFLPQIFLYGIVSLATAVLHSQHKLSIPAYTPIANNLVVTAMFVAARPLMERVGNGTSSQQTLLLVLGIGTTLGVIAQALPLIGPMRDGVVRLRWNLAFRHPVVKRLVRLSGWTMGYVVANQVSLYVVTNLANSGPEGTVATYQYAFAFFQLPHGLIAVSLMTAVLPRLATSFVDGDLAAYRANFREGLNVLFTVVLAASAGYIVVAELLVKVVFERGAFSASGTDETARTLIAFAVGLPAFSTYLYAIRAFHARQNTRTPFWVNALENSLNIVLAVVLTTRTASGLALAFSGAYLIAAIIAVLVLNFQVRELVDRSLFTMMAKAMAAAVATVLGALIPSIPPLSALDWAPAQLILRVVLGGAAFVLAVALLRIEGLDRYVSVLRRKLGPFVPGAVERLLARTSPNAIEPPKPVDDDTDRATTDKSDETVGS